MDDHIKPEDWEMLLMFNRMLLIDSDELYELKDEWLSEWDQEERRWQQQQYHWNVATAPTIPREWVEHPEEEDEVPMLLIDDNDDDDDGDYWQPRQLCRQPVPNRWY